MFAGWGLSPRNVFVEIDYSQRGLKFFVNSGVILGFGLNLYHGCY